MIDCVISTRAKEITFQFIMCDIIVSLSDHVLLFQTVKAALYTWTCSSHRLVSLP